MHWGEVSTTESFCPVHCFTAPYMLFDALTPDLVPSSRAVAAHVIDLGGVFSRENPTPSG
nr:hypothetical protein [Candidatus Sigynarchaeum springense]